ncbi:hypothetical protein [uncultured Nostoc sp.]|uniref:hypothetical protein n=1 Tax=uncultured Nostoc sp. TaxID=340711 RepID=UPI00260E503A|nr:hypothetical protein [uncultured Nostoc sp.]
MEQKRAKRGSFQARILNLFRDNPDKKFTFHEIADELAATAGSTSGTLSVLYKNGSIQKTNDHPAMYFYTTDIGANSFDEVKLDNESVQESITEQERPNLALVNILNKLKKELEEVEERRGKLKSAIEVLEEQLNIEKII